MPLNTVTDSMALADDRVRYIFEELRARHQKNTDDIFGAWRFFTALYPSLTETAQRRIDSSFLMVKYMKPDVDDVVTMLLYYGQRNDRITKADCFRFFKEERAESYYHQISELFRVASKDNAMNIGDRIASCIWMRVADKMYNRMRQHMPKNSTAKLFAIEDAYKLAKRSYEGLYRANGLPSVVRALSTAYILAKMEMDDLVIAAALLYDPIKDGACRIEDVAAFNLTLAQTLSAAFEMEQEFTEAHDQTTGALSSDALERLAHHISSTPGSNVGLYLQAASKIYDLHMIEDAGQARNPHIHAGAPDYMPLFQKFQMHRLIAEIQNARWRAAERSLYDTVKRKYRELLTKNRDCKKNFCRLLESNLSTEVNAYMQLFDSKGFDIDLCIRDHLPYEIYTLIEPRAESLRKLENRIHKKALPLCEVQIVFESRDVMATENAFITAFIKMFEKTLARTEQTIIDFFSTPTGAVFLVQDRYCNTFRCSILRREVYMSQLLGSGLGYRTSNIETADNENKEKDMINVLLKDNKMIRLPAHATVLDAAFAIHDALGYTVKYAYVNGKKSSIDSVLMNGDKVVIEADSGRDGKSRIVRARIDWLSFVVTDKAKQGLIKLLSEKYDGQQIHEKHADDNKVEQIASELLENLSDCL